MGGKYRLRCIDFNSGAFFLGWGIFLWRHKPRPFYFGGAVQMIEDIIILEIESQLNNGTENINI